MKTIIAGSRKATKKDVWNALCSCPWTKEISSVINGCARGADTFGAQWARSLNLPVKEFPAQWEIYGKSAGYKRNELMANNADALIAIWDSQSRGTKHMIALATKKNLQVFIWRLE